MTFRLLILLAFVSTLYSCNSDHSSQQQILNKETTNGSLDNQTKGEEQYVNIVDIQTKGNTTFLYADYVQFYTGDAAIEAAKKANQADTFQTEDGKTHIGVPNDYFIVNESKKVRQLLLSDNCVFELIINPDRIHPIDDNSLKSLRKVYKDSLFILTLNDKGVVVKIKEVLLP